MATRIQIRPSYEWSKEAMGLGITHRELEVFALASEGFTYKEIASILHIKHQSVKNHMHSMTKKLGTRNVLQALVLAVHLNLISVVERVRYRDFKADLKMTEEQMVRLVRELIDGELVVAGLKDKDIRALRVFLLAHGIDVDAEKDKSEADGDSLGGKRG